MITEKRYSFVSSALFAALRRAAVSKYIYAKGIKLARTEPAEGKEDTLSFAEKKFS